MKNTNLIDKSREISEYLIQKYSNAKNSEDLALIEEMKRLAPGDFFVPFLQFFLRYLSKNKKTLNSKFVLKTLIEHSSELDEEEVVAYVKMDNAIKVGDNKYLSRDIILNEILKQDLIKSFNYVLDKAASIEIEEMQEKVFDHIDKNELIELIYDESTDKSLIEAK